MEPLGHPLIFSLRGSSTFVDGREFKDTDLAQVPLNTEALSLENSQVTDAGVHLLKRLSGLRCLDLDGTAITDAALTTIGCMNSIEELWLEATNVTDAGLVCLSKLDGLRFVSFAHCASVSDGAIATLKTGLPMLKVST